MSNQTRGFITIDFIFSFLIIFGFFQLYFLICMTLTIAHTTQYVTYSASRAYFLGATSQLEQKQNSLKNFKKLQGLFGKFYGPKWFVINEDRTGAIDDGEISYTNKKPQSEARQAYTGFRTSFRVKGLEFRLPFLGSTSESLDNPEAGFQANMYAFMFREPSSEECYEFMKLRFQAIKNLKSGFMHPNVKQPAIKADNGC